MSPLITSTGSKQLDNARRQIQIPHLPGSEWGPERNCSHQNLGSAVPSTKGNSQPSPDHRARGGPKAQIHSLRGLLQVF